MTGGPERRDESVKFSLQELMKLEDERVDQEKRAHDAREAAAAAARDDKTRREREAIAARERAENDERERVRLRELDEEARREAIQRAAVEQARITVEARTRAEESELERRHEIELQRMRAETVKKPGAGGYVASGLLGAAITLAMCLVLYFAVSRPATDQRIAELDRAVATAEGRTGELSRRIDEQKARAADLQKSLDDAKAEITRLGTVRPVAPAPTTPSHINPGPSRSGPGTGNPPGGKLPLDNGPCVSKFDPLCGHIGN
jgi:hypothetical protein